MSAADLLDRLARTPDPPCAHCLLRQQCADLTMACEQFLLFVNLASAKRVAAAERQPSMGIYRRVFKAKDGALVPRERRKGGRKPKAAKPVSKMRVSAGPGSRTGAGAEGAG
jgi:hypothetical protein